MLSLTDKLKLVYKYDKEKWNMLTHNDKIKIQVLEVLIKIFIFTTLSLLAYIFCIVSDYFLCLININSENHPNFLCVTKPYNTL